MYEWDEAKRQATLFTRGIDFADMDRFDWATATVKRDIRRAYDETRFVSIGYIGDRLYFCAWTPRVERIRIISLRKANAREEKEYVQDTADDRRRW